MDRERLEAVILILRVAHRPTSHRRLRRGP
jgi:hypothetical protein